jgi:hypothetical protein
MKHGSCLPYHFIFKIMVSFQPIVEAVKKASTNISYNRNFMDICSGYSVQNASLFILLQKHSIFKHNSYKSLTTNTLMASSEATPLYPNLKLGTLAFLFSLDYECCYLSPALSLYKESLLHHSVSVRVPLVGVKGILPLLPPWGLAFITWANT